MKTALNTTRHIINPALAKSLSGLPRVGFLLSGVPMKKIPLTQGQFAVVDDVDHEKLSQHKWYAKKDPHTFYAKRNLRLGKKWTKVTMHRIIMQPPDSMEVDHRDGNGLNNQRYNLRVCTHAENMHNRRKTRGTSKFKGVYWLKKNRKWRAHIVVYGKNIHIGLYTDEIEAAKAYDKKAKELFGEFAYLNFRGDSYAN